MAGGIRWYACDVGSWRDTISVVYPAVPSQVAIGSMTTYRGHPGAVTMPDGRVLIAGDAATPELFDAATGMSVASSAAGLVRSRGTATSLGGGRVLLTGRAGEGALEVYDATTDTIARVGTFDQHRYAHSVTRLENSDVLIARGNGNVLNALDDAYLWVPR